MKTWVMAYSGGLDTRAALHWLKSKGDKVVTVLVDVGQGDDLQALAQNATFFGADDVHIVNMIEPFVTRGLLPQIRAGAYYENNYLLGTAIARPFLGHAIVETAMKVGAANIVHGATEKGNDYLRIEQTIRRLCPELNVTSVWSLWDLKNRDEMRALLRDAAVSKGLTQSAVKPNAFSVDANLWHTSYEGGELEDLAQPLPKVLVEAMSRAGSATVTIRFENGCPVALNGKNEEPAKLIQNLNHALAETGYGWIDLVETRTNGIKSRGVYHTPAGTILYRARQALNECWFAHETMEWLNSIAPIYGRLVYTGQWDHSMRQALDAATESLYQGTAGEVTLAVKGSHAFVEQRSANPMRFSSDLGGFHRSQAWTPAHQAMFVDVLQLQWHSKPFLAHKGV